MSANNFKLTLDTIAPNGSFTSPVGALTYAKNTITAGLSTDGAAYMKVWADSSATTSTAPANGLDGEPLVWEVAASTKTLTLSPDGLYYLHAIFMDDVGNQSAVKHSGQVQADTVAPNIAAFYAHDKDDINNHSYANDSTFGAFMTLTDGGTSPSQIKSITISGNIVNSPVSISPTQLDASTHSYDASLTFSNAATDPSDQTITITVTDNSGNTSTQTATIHYDTQPASATLFLKKPGSNDDLGEYISGTTTTTSPHYNLYDAVITSSDTDIVSYKIWEGDSEPDPWEDWTGSPVKDEGRSFTTTDGTKTIHAKVRDAAGNITILTPQTRTYDATVPVVTISRADEWIANGTGSKNSTNISFTATDATSGLASGSPSFTCNGTAITGVSTSPFSFSASTPGARVGANTITISATDNAGNTNTASVVVNIEDAFVIDSLTLSGYELYSAIYRAANKDNIAVAVNNSTAPGSGRATLQVWTDQVADNETVPASTPNVTWNSATQTVASTNINKSFAESAANYLHVKAISNVGTVAYKHIAFTVDETKPTFTATITTAVPTNTRALNIDISSIADNLSGADKMKVYAGAGTSFDSGADSDWVAATNGARSLALSSSLNSGTYEVLIDVRDKAGNVTQHSLTWEYDSVAPEGVIVLKETDGTNKASPSADKTFKVNVTYTADTTDVYNKVQYLLWGDFALTDGGAQVTEETAVWTTFTSASVDTNTLYCTPNASTSTSGETKTVYFKLKDDAGNIKQGTSASFVYNPNAATLTISNVSHERISCVHDLRKTTSGGDVVDTDKYADVMSFTVSADQDLYELKVAAYTTETYPESGTTGANITAMTARSGSYGSNYHPTGNPITQPITVTVDGQDYRAAIQAVKQVSADTNVDGTHYIVVFGKNNAGTWSIAGTKVA